MTSKVHIGGAPDDTYVVNNNNEICYEPLGGNECQCVYGNKTCFIIEAAMNWDKATLTYKFAEPELPDFIISRSDEVSAAVSVLLLKYINIAEKNITPLMKFTLDGKELKLDGAKKLLALRQAHTLKYHS